LEAFIDIEELLECFGDLKDPRSSTHRHQPRTTAN